MLLSMTGFGQAEAEINGVLVKVELKSLNSKFLDIGCKLPKELSSRETEMRSLFQQMLKRGKINGLVEVVQTENETKPVTINEALLKAYHEKYKRLAADLGEETKDIFKLALHSPEVISQDDEELRLEWEDVQDVFVKACEKCNAFRLEEGKSLEIKFREYISTIAKNLAAIAELDKPRIENIKRRIDKNLDEIREKVQVDENRFEQELIYYIEKLDITEEKVRLGRHLDYFLEVMNSKESEGKKLGFISQEIGREINTIGSKANDPDMQQLVVEMKDELEKIKEQLLNIL